jgi:hypothetical protein
MTGGMPRFSHHPIPTSRLFNATFSTLDFLSADVHFPLQVATNHKEIES